METLQSFIQSNPRPQDLKRALAVQMVENGHRYRQIQDILQVSIGFITSSKQRYEAQGITGLRSNYWGTQGYLTAQQKEEVMAWMASKEVWTIEEVMEHLEVEYNVVYRSRQSYYTLMAQAGFSWKKAHPSNPGKDEEQVAKKNRKSSTYWHSINPISPVAN
jgi:putative transposase